VEDQEGAVLGVLWHFAAHPTTAMRSEFAISADYPGVVNRAVTEALGCPCIFFNGAAGNINPELGERNFERMREHGERIAADLLPPLKETRPAESPLSPGSRSAVITVPLTDKEIEPVADETLQEIETFFETNQEIPDTIEALEKNWQRFQQLRTAWWRHALRIYLWQRAEETIRIKAHRLGDRLILAVPGELFTELQTRLARAFPGYRAMVVGWANGYCGYIPDRESFQVAGYETNPSIVHRTGPGAGEKIIDEGKNLLEELID
jgi:hypothetical protein